MSDREKALEAVLERVESELSVFMRAGVSDSECPGWVEDLHSAARAALAMPATVDRADFLRGWESGPETLDLLAFHLRNMADSMSMDQIDADRINRAADTVDIIRNLTPPEDKQ